MKKVLFSIFLIMSTLNLFAQQATVLDSKSMTVPRYANLAAVTTAITTPQTGMMVYNIQTQSYWYYNGAWTNLASSLSGSQWTTTGNNIYYSNDISLNNPISTYSNITNFPIPDNNSTGVTSTINVPLNGNIIDANLITISIALNHTWAGDIVATLTSPDGDSFILLNRLGAFASTSVGWGGNFISSNVISFNNLASGQIANPGGSGDIPAGTYLPSAGSAYISTEMINLYGIKVNGNWSLKIQDFFSGDVGSLVSWSIKFGANSIANVGKVGIGVSSPTEQFEVATKIKAKNLQLTNDASLNRVLVSDANGNASWQSTLNPEKIQFSNFPNTQKIVLYNNKNTSQQFFGFGMHNGILRYQTDTITADHVFYSAINSLTSIELFRIKGNGNVGVGISVPTYKLDVLHGGGSGIRSKSSSSNSTIDIDAFNGDAELRFFKNGVGNWRVRNNPINDAMQIFEFGVGERLRIDKTTGKVWVNNDFTVLGVKAFSMDHPLDPENKILMHVAAESNEVINFYSGNITTNGDGKAIVHLPNYFESINKDFRYQLTIVGGVFARAIVSKEVIDNTFEISTDIPNVKVSWEVKGVRNDLRMQKNPFQAETEKSPNMKGKYLDPSSHNQALIKGFNYEKEPSSLTESPKVQNETNNVIDNIGSGVDKKVTLETKK